MWGELRDARRVYRQLKRSMKGTAPAPSRNELLTAATVYGRAKPTAKRPRAEHEAKRAVLLSAWERARAR